MMRCLLAIPLLLAVAGCSHPRIEFPKPPADKLVCPDEPPVPAAPVSDEANGAYLKAMRAAWAGCRSDVDWLRIWFRELDRK